MTEALSSLYPTNQIGSDGFNWWIGQVESVKTDDPKGGGRWKVRILGLHPRECNTVPSSELPWARVVMPASTPHLVGGVTSVSSQLEPGAWVVGFFLDNDKQQPAIIGSLGQDPNSTGLEVTDDPTPGESGCKSFTTFRNPENAIAYDRVIDDTNKPTIADSGGTGDGHKREKSSGIDEGTANAITSTNFCVEVADKCGKESDMTGTFTRLFGEMLHEIQRNDGKLGDYLVGELSGGLYDAIDVGRKYVNKAITIIRTFIAKIKGFVVEQIKKAVKFLTNALLKPTKLGNSLTKVTKFFNESLKKLGCKMADLSDRLAKWLEDMIFGYLFNIYKQTACQVDRFVNGVIGKIQSLMSELLSSILGPLQDILGAIAAPLNMIGDAINYVLNLLGIQCSGPPKSCGKKTKICVKGDTDERKNFLDRLLEDLENDFLGDVDPDWSQYICDDATDGRALQTTDVVFVGGIQDDIATGNVIRYSINDILVREGELAVFTITRTGKIDVASSVSFTTRDGTATAGEDYQENDGLVGFAPGVTEKTVEIRTFLDYNSEGSEDFFVRIVKETPDTVKATASRNVGRCTILENDPRVSITPTTSTGDDIDPLNPFDTSINPENPDNVFDAEVADPSTDPSVVELEEDEEVQLVPTYQISSDRVTVKEGEFVTYTITTTNVVNGSEFEYRLFGANITPSDFITGNMSGTFTIEDSKATVVVGIAEDSEFETAETLVFSIPGTGATLSVLIDADSADFSEEEIIEAESGYTTEEQIIRPPSVPVVGDIITTPDGEILDIPVLDTGDPYVEPPFVLVTGNGFNASAIPLTDDRGYLTEIRVTDPGTGYKLRTPNDAVKECIIDSFTMLSPGREYDSAPTVYVNGDDSVAEAIINEKGQVISVRIKNRELTFSAYPKVLIVGGGGFGAKFLPSFSCLEPEARVRIGSAKVGTGSYIDCP